MSPLVHQPSAVFRLVLKPLLIGGLLDRVFRLRLHVRSAGKVASDLPETDLEGEVLEAAFLASAGDCREITLAVKSCMTGRVQRRCQCELVHHPLCCQILSGWACGSERRNVAYACVGPFSEGSGSLRGRFIRFCLAK